MVEGGGERVSGDVRGGGVSWVLGFCFEGNGLWRWARFGAAGFETAFGCVLGLGGDDTTCRI